MMGFDFGSIAQGFADGLSKNLFKFGEKALSLIPDPNKKAELQQEIDKMNIEFQGKKLEFDKAIDQQLSDRHKYDMQSDSKLSKNIRPCVLMYLMGLWTIILFASLAGYEVSDMLLMTFGGMTGTAFTFYFGSRGFEKYGKMKYGGKE